MLLHMLWGIWARWNKLRNNYLVFRAGNVNLQLSVLAVKEDVYSTLKVSIFLTNTSDSQLPTVLTLQSLSKPPTGRVTVTNDITFYMFIHKQKTSAYILELVEGVFSPHKLMIGGLWGWPSPITDPLLVEGEEGVSSLGRGGFSPPIADPGLDVAELIPHGLHPGSWGFPAFTEPELVVASILFYW